MKASVKKIIRYLRRDQNCQVVEGHPEKQVIIMRASANHSVAPYLVHARLSLPMGSAEDDYNTDSPTTPSAAHHPASICEVRIVSHFGFFF